ncbi:MAG: hypothetical protein DDT21_00011 [Syntrophomonadaceae bacterium]|nr:hypothetical protein [Bacillota bacterium]
MQIEIKIEETCTEPRVVIFAPRMTDEVNEILKKLSNTCPLTLILWGLKISRFSLRSVHRYCFKNRVLIEQSMMCGCFYCLAIFTPGEIDEWTDGPLYYSEEYGQTALCPRCGIDSVLPDNIPGVQLDSAILLKMKKYYFGGMGSGLFS